MNKKRGKRNPIDFQTLLAAYPLVREFVNKIPRLKERLERGVKKGDLTSFVYLEMLQSRAELRNELKKGRNELSKGMDGLKDEFLKSSILTALMANPELRVENIKQYIIEKKEKTEAILQVIRSL